MKSLQDQLLTAGLTDKQSVKNVRKQKQKQHKKPKNAQGEASEITKQVEQAQREKASRDKELNRQRQSQTERKAQYAQIQQLIETSKIDRTEAELTYHFTVAGKVKSIKVTSEQQKQLARNQIAIVFSRTDKLELVPRAVAEKIAQRDMSRVVENKTEGDAQTADDDPYADYQIPDDLVW